MDAIVGYDGSPGASVAIAAGALLFPGAHGWITYLWVPPFASEKVRRRLRPMARDANELAEMVEREGECEAERIVGMGVTLARAAGWHAEPLLKRTWGPEGCESRKRSTM
ncbi:universal stress family protein, partial [Mycobacterium kansasii]